jgi:hypothetical protein
MGTNKEIVYRYCLREKVKIQDKVALEDFSESTTSDSTSAAIVLC